MSIYRCNRCPYTTASHWLLKEHEFSTHVQNIKIDPNSPRAPTTVSFGPDVAKAPTSIHVSHSVQRGYGVDDVDMNRVVKSRKHGKRACGTRMRRLRNPQGGNSRAKCHDNEIINKVALMRLPQCSLTTMILPQNIKATSQQ